ncbi:hypothetical protein [Sphingosinicella sp. CPCC 101087]|uniref:hypothetical protein n=1 Tax=Sphingosinicella sp. CPCC 101087 TaxID=2497754 RepID=UPI00101C2317|nr:hypothetical protein [Sphingosinicella sp. CPCC 101087]
MRNLITACAVTALAILASCAPIPAPPAPAPPPPPAPAPAPPPPAPPPPAVWEDAPPSPGDWRLNGPSAAFGSAQGPELIVRCEGDRQVSLIRAGARSGTSLTIRTTYGARALPAAPRPEGLAARLAASDPLLDSIVFSRGRFAVEAPGLPRLVVPAWPEPARIVEDCRA